MSRTVSHDPRGFLEIRFSFDRGLVDLVKTLPDRRWNPAERFWSVPAEAAVELVDLLRSRGFAFDEATRALYRSLGGQGELGGADAGAGQLDLFGVEREPETGPSVDPTDYSISRLNREVRSALSEAFPGTIWLVGEIHGFNKASHKRIVGFQLAEREDGGKTLSEVNAVLFENTRRDLERKLAAAGDPFRLEDEVTVRMRVRVDLYEPWGQYRVVIDDLDLSYTLGEAARRREEIVRRLTEEGLVALNKELPLAAVPLRVGLVASLGSDAYNDVLRTLEESGFAFVVQAHGARVQGPATEPSVLNALDWFREQRDRFDTVLICRGGGSRIDLAWFDSEALGRAVATFPLPVLVGIGHEQDQSVLDAVGWTNKTPTAAAAFLVERVRAALDRVEECGRGAVEGAVRRLTQERGEGIERARRLARAAGNLVERQRDEWEHRRRRAVLGVRAMVQAARRELSHRSRAIPQISMMRVADRRGRLERSEAQLEPLVARRLELERERTSSRRRRLELVHPRRVLARGYAILRRGARVVRRPEDAPAGTEIEAELHDGRLTARSLGPANDD